MRKIPLNKWKSRMPVMDKNGNPTSEFTEIDEDLLTVLNLLISNKRPEEIPRGLDKFRLFNRLGKAFEKADETRILELEETDYEFLKEIVEKDIPSILGMNQDISKAIEDFLNAKTQE